MPASSPTVDVRRWSAVRPGALPTPTTSDAFVFPFLVCPNSPQRHARVRRGPRGSVRWQKFGLCHHRVRLVADPTGVHVALFRRVIRTLADEDVAEAERLVGVVLGGRLQARLNEVIDVLALPGVGAWDAGRLVGIATYAVDGSEAEVAALGVAEAHRGEAWRPAARCGGRGGCGAGVTRVAGDDQRQPHRLGRLPAPRLPPCQLPGRGRPGTSDEADDPRDRRARNPAPRRARPRPPARLTTRYGGPESGGVSCCVLPGKLCA